MDYENWYIDKMIGNGAYASVYLVKHISKDPQTMGPKVQYFAMKCIKKSLVRESKYALSTMRERSCLLAMDHPFILKLHYAFQTPNALYMIFDFINGGDMFFHIEKNRNLSEKEARYYGAQIILGLEYLQG